MIDLESQLDLIEPLQSELTGGEGLLPIAEDYELSSRIARLAGDDASAQGGPQQ